MLDWLLRRHASHKGERISTLFMFVLSTLCWGIIKYERSLEKGVISVTLHLSMWEVLPDACFCFLLVHPSHFFPQVFDFSTFPNRKE